jgi:hypothetical protein
LFGSWLSLYHPKYNFVNPLFLQLYGLGFYLSLIFLLSSSIAIMLLFYFMLCIKQTVGRLYILIELFHFQN